MYPYAFFFPLLSSVLCTATGDTFHSTLNILFAEHLYILEIQSRIILDRLQNTLIYAITFAVVEKFPDVQYATI